VRRRWQRSFCRYGRCRHIARDLHRCRRDRGGLVGTQRQEKDEGAAEGSSRDREWTEPGGSGCAPSAPERHRRRLRKLLGRDGLLRQEQYLAAGGAGVQVSKRLLPLGRGERALSEGGELVWLEMGLEVASGLERLHHEALVVVLSPLSENGRVGEACSSVRKFRSRSRGSTPSCSCAARRLIPADSRRLSSC
jgi:hypothetical protein